MRTDRYFAGRGWLAAGALGGLLLAAAPAHAQDPAKKDEALEKLLEKLEGPKPGPGAEAPKASDDAKKPDPKPDSKPASDPGKKDAELEKLLEKLEGPKPAADAPKVEPGKPGESPKPGEATKPAAPGGEVAGKDESLDKLLEGLGGADDKPTAEGKKSQPAAGSGDESKPDQPPQPGGPGEDKKGQERPLDRGEQTLDQRLEELTGRKPKKKDDDKQQGKGQGQGQGGEEDQGPLGDLVKQMRDVEQRLGQPDTGAETRQKQGEIVKNLDTLLEQARNGGSGKSMLTKGPGKPGGKPQPGQPGNQAGAEGVGPSKPTPPRTPPPPVELAKAVWGQLPASVRDDMDSILKETALPGKADMIRLYYLSLAKKSTSGGN